MQIQTLHPDLRKNLRNLLQGYVEHCEVSPHLTGRIDFPIYYQGFKYGAPVFTHVGPGAAHEDRPVIGFIGWNTPSSQLPSQVLLQFIEILTQHSRLAGSAVLRILPVANPVALELGEDAPARDDWDWLGRLADQFRQQAADGFIEVHAGDVTDFTLSGEISPALYHALARADEISPAIRADRPGVRLPANVQLKPTRRDERWQLRLLVPQSWQDATSVHALARFLVRLVHLQAKLARPARRRLRPAS